MKKISIILTLLVLLASSCSKDGADLLDAVTTGLGEDDVFKSAQNTTLFLNDIYGDLLPVIASQTGNKTTRWGGDALLEVSTDDGSSNLGNGLGFWNFNSGAWTAGSTTFSTNDWSRDWTDVRACNLFLAKIDEVPLDPEFHFTEEVRNIRKAEAKFLLAFNYADLIKQFGGLPLLTEPAKVTDDMNVPRSTYDETVNFIVQLCDEAAASLPLVHPDADYGRATKGAALALKARVLLYAASPLWNNPANTEDCPFRGKYDLAKWTKAANAANAVIDLNQYQLHPDISNLFLTRVNPELIFVHMNQPSCYMTSISVPNRLYPPGAAGKSGCNQVTYNMVKEYEVLKNGKAYSIDDPLSGYNPNDPYKNRDPRLYRDCMFNGYRFQGVSAEFGVPEPGGTKVPKHNPTEVGSYYTYVFNIKFADLSLKITADARTPANGIVTNQNFPYLRYAEVLLNYAEAMNEAFGPEVDGLGNGKTALWAVNQVRTRAKYENKQEYLGQIGNMPAIETGLSKAALREKIRHERRVELSFEEHRFWDVRRWMIDPATLVDIKAQIPVWKNDGTVTYEIRTIDTRIMDKKMYRMPIPENQLFANPKLVQNPGWPYSPEVSAE